MLSPDYQTCIQSFAIIIIYIYISTDWQQHHRPKNNCHDLNRGKGFLSIFFFSSLLSPWRKAFSTSWDSQLDITKDFYEALILQGKRGGGTTYRCTSITLWWHPSMTVKLFHNWVLVCSSIPIPFVAPPSSYVFHFSHFLLLVRIYLPNSWVMVLPPTYTSTHTHPTTFFLHSTSYHHVNAVRVEKQRKKPPDIFFCSKGRMWFKIKWWKTILLEAKSFHLN